MYVKLGNFFLHFPFIYFICPPKIKGNKKAKESGEVGVEKDDTNVKGIRSLRGYGEKKLHREPKTL